MYEVIGTDDENYDWLVDWTCVPDGRWMVVFIRIGYNEKSFEEQLARFQHFQGEWLRISVGCTTVLMPL
jgi:hypothetical protein